VADAAGDDPDERLAAPGLLQLDVLDDERLPELLEDCGPDVQGVNLHGAFRARTAARP
jgi:hypothetical protein